MIKCRDRSQLHRVTHEQHASRREAGEKEYVSDMGHAGLIDNHIVEGGEVVFHNERAEGSCAKENTRPRVVIQTTDCVIDGRLCIAAQQCGFTGVHVVSDQPGDHTGLAGTRGTHEQNNRVVTTLFQCFALTVREIIT